MPDTPAKKSELKPRRPEKDAEPANPNTPPGPAHHDEGQQQA